MPDASVEAAGPATWLKGSSVEAQSFNIRNDEEKVTRPPHFPSHQNSGGAVAASERTRGDFPSTQLAI